MSRAVTDEVVREVLRQKHPVSKNLETLIDIVIPILVDAYEQGFEDGKAAGHE